jgi:L-alanine-DL-glutamate epimerase-like enolase superfamily enzyme
MKIVDVEIYVVPSDEGPPTRWREGLPVHLASRDEEAWFRVVTDEGIDGVCHVPGSGDIAALIAQKGLRELMIGEDPLAKERLWHRVWELDRLQELPIYVLGIMDIALWDLTAKLAGLPLHAVLGGYRDAIPAYASTATFGSVEEYLDVADQCLDLGFRAIKLHAWGDARRDARLCEKLREHVGPDIGLMYDGSAGFDPYDALYLGRALEKVDYLWYEEPMREFQIDAYCRLSDALDIPVLGAETSDGAHYTAAEWLVRGACDMVRTGVDFHGGVTGAMRVAHLADAFGRTAEVHGDGLPNLHLCCAVRNCTMYESMVLTNPVVRAPEVGADGSARVPDAPGIGYEFDFDDIARLAQASGTVVSAARA